MRVPTQLEVFEETRAARTVQGIVVALPKIVAVVFPNSRTEYSYYCDIDGIKPGDYAIVASPYAPTNTPTANALGFHSEEMGGYPTVVRVVRTEETTKDVSKAAKWIIQKIDIDKYVERLTAERRVDVLKAKIKRAKEEAMERAQMATLRSLSPELDLLITELASLTGVPIEDKPVEVRAHRRKRTPAVKAKTTSTRSKARTPAKVTKARKPRK